MLRCGTVRATVPAVNAIAAGAAGAGGAGPIRQGSL